MPLKGFYIEIIVNIVEISKDHPNYNRCGHPSEFATAREAEKEKFPVRKEGVRSALPSGCWLRAREAGLRLLDTGIPRKCCAEAYLAFSHWF